MELIKFDSSLQAQKYTEGGRDRHVEQDVSKPKRYKGKSISSELTHSTTNQPTHHNIIIIDDKFSTYVHVCGMGGRGGGGSAVRGFGDSSAPPDLP